MSDRPTPWVDAGPAEEVRAAGRKVVRVGPARVLVLFDRGRFFAMDNRCPHMGFPLDQGDVHDGLLDCHWHHARFDVTCGATLDPWADDGVPYRVEVREGRVYVDPHRVRPDPRAHGLARLERGLEDDISLVIAKAVLEIHEGGVDPREAIALAARYGATQRADGWQPGLSILSAMANVLPALDPEDRPRALFQSVRRIASDCAGQAPRRPLPALESSDRDLAGLTAWFRETVEVRDDQGAERVLRTIVERHGSAAALDAVIRAATDHRYSAGGHVLDYAVKCAELAETVAGFGASDLVPLLFTSLVPGLTSMERMEETSAWRRPVDVAALVEEASASLPEAPFAAPPGLETLADESRLVDTILAEDPAVTVKDLVRRLREGESPVACAEAVVAAAVLRVLRFGTSNETPDWDTVHHTLTYANAVAEAMRRVPSSFLFRAVLDGAMSVYLDRFLNTPPAPLPREAEGDGLEILQAYDRRSAVQTVGALAWGRRDPARLLATLGHAVLREDVGFHEFQQVDIAWRRLGRRGSGEPSRLALTATARWLASQLPTKRAREQTFQIARRLRRGEDLHEG